jgi:hypothetical protein
MTLHIPQYQTTTTPTSSLTPSTRSKYNVVRILSVQQEGTSKVRIIKLVQKKKPKFIHNEIISIDDDDDDDKQPQQPTAIEILDSDEEESIENIRKTMITHGDDANDEISKNSHGEISHHPQSPQISEKSTHKFINLLDLVQKIKSRPRKEMKNVREVMSGEIPTLGGDDDDVLVMLDDEKDVDGVEVEDLPVAEMEDLLVPINDGRFDDVVDDHHGHVNEGAGHVNGATENHKNSEIHQNTEKLQKPKKTTRKRQLKVINDNHVTRRKSKMRKSDENMTGIEETTAEIQKMKMLDELTMTAGLNGGEAKICVPNGEDQPIIENSTNVDGVQVVQVPNHLQKNKNDEPQDELTIQPTIEPSIEPNQLEITSKPHKNDRKITKARRSKPQRSSMPSTSTTTNDITSHSHSIANLLNLGLILTKSDNNMIGIELKSPDTIEDEPKITENIKNRLENHQDTEELQNQLQNHQNQLENLQKHLKDLQVDIQEIPQNQPNKKSPKSSRKPHKPSQKSSTRSTKSLSHQPTNNRRSTRRQTTIYDDISAAIFSPQTDPSQPSHPSLPSPSLQQTPTTLPPTPPPSPFDDNHKLDFTMKLKCHKTCTLSNVHQKKHRVDISSPVGVMITRRDVVDEKYIRESLRRIEENSKAPKVDRNEQWIHATSGGRVFKTPRGRFGRKLPVSDVLEEMREAGKGRSYMTRRF